MNLKPLPKDVTEADVTLFYSFKRTVTAPLTWIYAAAFIAINLLVPTLLDAPLSTGFTGSAAFMVGYLIGAVLLDWSFNKKIIEVRGRTNPRSKQS